MLPTKEKEDASVEKKKAYESVVVFGNRGEWPHEAHARLVFEDGKVLDRVLPADARWVRLRIRYSSKLAWAAVDPDRVNTWDWNRLNDSKVLASGHGAAVVLSRRAPAKYTGMAAFLLGLWNQLAWALA